MVPPGSDASSGDNDAEDISESSSDGEDSDAEDVFKLKARKPDECEKPYKNFFLCRWQEATAKVMQMLRSDVLLPLQPTLGHLGVVWKQVDEAIALPAWHCAFAKCSVTSASWDPKKSNEGGLWQHICGKHKPELQKVIAEYKLQEKYLEEDEVMFTLYNQALLE